MQIEFLDDSHKEDDGLVTMPIAAVFLAVKSVLDTGGENEFIAACKEQDLTLRGPVEVVNLAKTFVKGKMPETPPLTASASHTRAAGLLGCRDPSQCPDDV